MPRYISLAFGIVGLLVTGRQLSAQHVWFAQDFRQDTSRTQWVVASGDWRFEPGGLQIDTRAYDQLLSSRYYLFDTVPYSIEVVLRGARAGLYFSLDDPTNKALSHMVRFDERSLLVGYFDGAGVYTATATLEPDAPAGAWTRLRVDVHPAENRYQVFVNNQAVGQPQPLRFPSGYFGLQASAGTAEFRSVRVFAEQPPRPPKAPEKGQPVRFNHVRYVRSAGRNLILYNPELGLLQTVDPEGRLLEQRKVETMPDLKRGSFQLNRIFTVEANQVRITDLFAAREDSIVDRLVAPHQVLASESGSVFVVDAGAHAVFKYDATGRFLKAFRAEAAGGLLAPRGLDWYGLDELVIADYNRLVFVDTALTELRPLVAFVSPTEARIVWKQTVADPPELDYAADGEGWTRVRGTVRAGQCEVSLPNLKPQTRYSFTFFPTLKTLPRLDRHSREHRFVTPPADSSQMLLTRLPVLVLVYRTVSYRDRFPLRAYPHLPDGRTLGEDELEALRQAVRLNRAFYFRNSGCRLVLDFDFAVVEDTLWLSEIGADGPYWLEPNARVVRDFEAAAQRFGRVPSAYAGLVCLYAWRNYPPRRASALADPTPLDTVEIRQAYGGGTYGVPAPWKYGTTTGYTAIPFQDRLQRPDWLILHEFHHQLDALMAASGYEAYPHADQPWSMPGRFGEDFDFNAQILRSAERQTWLALRFGRLAAVKDADHDGVPDADTTLPFDELRLRGRPTTADSDGDGLSDLQEVLAGIFRGTRLDAPDSDGDALSDAADPEPLYPVSPVRPRVEAATAFPTSLLGRIQEEDLNAEIYLDWHDQALLVGYVADRPANVLLQIDADHDGWFHGRDNFQIRVQNDGDTLRVLDYYLRDASSWSAPPEDRKDLLSIEELELKMRVTSSRDDESRRYRVVVRVPPYPQYGLALRSGEKLAVRVGLQVVDDRWVWYEPFERNKMFTVELR